MLEWRARISEPREMVPWICAWGSDVEVLATEALIIGRRSRKK